MSLLQHTHVLPLPGDEPRRSRQQARVQIHSEGGRALARALRTNTSMCSLNLAMNRLGEEGGRAIFDVLRQHPSLTHLNTAHNALGPVTAQARSSSLSSATCCFQGGDLLFRVF